MEIGVCSIKLKNIWSSTGKKEAFSVYMVSALLFKGQVHFGQASSRLPTDMVGTKSNVIGLIRMFRLFKDHDHATTSGDSGFSAHLSPPVSLPSIIK